MVHQRKPKVIGNAYAIETPSWCGAASEKISEISVPMATIIVAKKWSLWPTRLRPSCGPWSVAG